MSIAVLLAATVALAIVAISAVRSGPQPAAVVDSSTEETELTPSPTPSQTTALEPPSAAPSRTGTPEDPPPALPPQHETPRLLVPHDADALQVQQTLSNYYNAINSSDYDTVIQQYSPSFADNFTEEELAHGLARSMDYDVVVHAVTSTSTGAEAWVTFVSIQAPRFGPEGESCTEWSLDYGFVRLAPVFHEVGRTGAWAA